MGVTAYAVYRNAELVATVGGDVVTVQLDVGYGDSHIQVAARDAAGNESAKTPPVLVTIAPPVVADTSSPSTPRDLAAVVNADGSVALSWTASRDNVGVTSYRITRNRTEVMVVDGFGDLGAGRRVGCGKSLPAGAGVRCGGELVVEDAVGVGEDRGTAA